MKRNTILTLILGIAILFGIVSSGLVIAQGIQNTKNFSERTVSSKKNYPHAWELKKTKLEKFSEISISLSYNNLSILPGDDYYLEYHMDGTCTEPEYHVTDGRFQLSEGHTQSKFRIGFHLFFNPGYLFSDHEPYYVNLYIPKKAYFDMLTIYNDSGNVEICDIQAAKTEIEADYGNVTLKDFTGEKLTINADSGNIKTGNITCDNLDISDEYGNISGGDFQISDQTTIKLDSGNLELSQLNTDLLTLSDEYGDCSIDNIKIKDGDIALESGNLTLKHAKFGTADIKNAYGNITLTLDDSVSNYNYDLDAEYGAVKLDGEKLEEDEDSEIHYHKDNGQKNEIRITCESGNITIR